VLLPCSVLRRVVVSVALCDTAGLLSSGGEASDFSSLVYGVADPVDSSVSSDSLVCRVYEDDFKVLVDTILVDPVRV